MAIRSPKKSGFTIVELVIVIVILAILASLVVVNYSAQRQDATNVKTIANINSYLDAIQAYRGFDGKYPSVPGEQPDEVKMVCLGTGYPDAKCGQISGQDIYESPVFLDSLSKYADANFPVGLDFGEVGGESFIGAAYGIDMVGGENAPHSGYGRVIEWYMIGEDKDCELSGSYSYNTANGNTACEIFLEPTA